MNWLTVAAIAHLVFLYALSILAFLTQPLPLAIIVVSIGLAATAITSGVLSLHFTRARSR